jgi:hypothetical protein
MGFLKKAVDFFSFPSHSRTMGILIMFVLASAISLTVIVAQQQQTLKQHAAGPGDYVTCGEDLNCNETHVKDTCVAGWSKCLSAKSFQNSDVIYSGGKSLSLVCCDSTNYRGAFSACYLEKVGNSSGYACTPPSPPSEDYPLCGDNLQCDSSHIQNTCASGRFQCLSTKTFWNSDQIWDSGGRKSLVCCDNGSNPTLTAAPTTPPTACLTNSGRTCVQNPTECTGKIVASGTADCPPYYLCCEFSTSTPTPTLTPTRTPTSTPTPTRTLTPTPSTNNCTAQDGFCVFSTYDCQTQGGQVKSSGTDCLPYVCCKTVSATSTPTPRTSTPTPTPPSTGNGTLSLIAVDSVTSRPISGASLTAKQGATVVQTSTATPLTISVPPGTYTLIVSAPCYEDDIEDMSIASGNNGSNDNFPLVAINPPPAGCSTNPTPTLGAGDMIIQLSAGTSDAFAYLFTDTRKTVPELVVKKNQILLTAYLYTLDFNKGSETTLGAGASAIGTLTAAKKGSTIKITVTPTTKGITPGTAYKVLLKSPKYLRVFEGNITAPGSGGTATLTLSKSLASGAGDANNDNSLDIIDYFTAVLPCIGSKSCSNKEAADINDDGQVDGIDLNFITTNLAKREGD